MSAKNPVMKYASTPINQIRFRDVKRGVFIVNRSEPNCTANRPRKIKAVANPLIRKLNGKEKFACAIGWRAANVIIMVRPISAVRAGERSISKIAFPQKTVLAAPKPLLPAALHTLPAYDGIAGGHKGGGLALGRLISGH